MGWLKNLLSHKHKWKRIGEISLSVPEGVLVALSCSCGELAYVDHYNSILNFWMYHSADCDCPWCEKFRSE